MEKQDNLVVEKFYYTEEISQCFKLVINVASHQPSDGKAYWLCFIKATCVRKSLTNERCISLLGIKGIWQAHDFAGK